MPAKRELSMRQLRHLLRLHHDGVSAREIGRRLGVARSTIQDNLKRAAAAGLAWPLADDVTDEALETRLFGRAGVTQGHRRRVEPNWAALARERPHPEQGFRTCLGILRAYRGLDPDRLEAVSARAVELCVLNCKGVASLLAHKPDSAAKDSRPATLFDHANLRGPGYYH